MITEFDKVKKDAEEAREYKRKREGVDSVYSGIWLLGIQAY